MRKFMSQSSRFTRSFNYTMPEYRPSSPQARKATLSLVVPATHNRPPESKGGRADERR